MTGDADGLRAHDLSFAYHGSARAALRHVDLAVTPRELVLITGASGCGKSTLALALTGLIPSRVHGELRGRVSFGGEPLTGLPPHQAAQFAGLVFQNPNVQLINQTVQSEVAFGPENLALPQPEIAARVEWALDVTGMAGMRTASTVTLSGGQKQRTAIAATLAMRPRVLVLDEPLSDLDPVGAQEVLGTLRRLAAAGTGVIVIEHRLDEVVPWADRVVLMDRGQIVLDRAPRGAWDDPVPWISAGVGTPDVVRLAAEVPAAFPGGAPLSAEEAAGVLRDTWFPAALARAVAARPVPAGPGAGLPAGGGSAGGPPVLSWSGVTVAFGGRTAVDEVSLSVAEGEWVALIGANASPWELSQGGRQRLALAALLVGAPGVLVLDEPTTGQDADHMRAFLRLLDRVRERTGLTVITVTHDMRAVASRASRIVLLGEGQVRLDGPPSQVFAQTAELARWSVLAPPLARLQSALLGDGAGEVLLTVDGLARAVLAHRPAHVGATGS